MSESSIAPTAGELSDVCNHQSGSSFPIAPQVWLLLSADMLPCSSRKAIFRAVLLGSRHSGGTPDVVTPGGSHARGD